MAQYEVILRRSRGRYVKSTVVRSTYRAKQIKKAWEEKYDETYSVEIVVK